MHNVICGTCYEKDNNNSGTKMDDEEKTDDDDDYKTETEDEDEKENNITNQFVPKQKYPRHANSLQWKTWISLDGLIATPCFIKRTVIKQCNIV